MEIIADSGGTKTDWILVGEGGIHRVRTSGYHPVHADIQRLSEIICEELLPQLPKISLDAVYYYGAGCMGGIQGAVQEALQASLQVENVMVASDLIGAARAVLCNKRGIVCILGTGANSALYDGVGIVQNVHPMGYILGDEGSGAAIGKRFLNALYKGWLSEEIKKDFESQMDLTYTKVIDAVYRKSGANKFLASLVPYIKEVSLHCNTVQNLVQEELGLFVERNIRAYNTTDVPIGVVGGVAKAFEPLLRNVMQEYGYELSVILGEPIEGLLKYHEQTE